MAGFASGAGSKQEVRELEQFERKRAAIETIFTVALLYLAGLQVWTTANRELNFLIAITPVITLLALALLLGGGNLLNQIKSELWSAS